MHTCYLEQTGMAGNEFVEAFMNNYAQITNADQADMQQYVHEKSNDSYTVEIVQGRKQHLEYHWIDKNYYALWYDDDCPGLKYGDKYPKSKDLFEVLVEDYVMDTPARAGVVMSNSIESILSAKDYFLRKKYE